MQVKNTIKEFIVKKLFFSKSTVKKTILEKKKNIKIQ